MISATASSSNSTSSSSAEVPKRYDVFLSFRGEDTRVGFTSYLYYALKQKQVETYIDNRLERGDGISASLMKAIEESHVSIIIFSENYASSKWCLQELSKIMKCKGDHGQVVIPVFYRIDPSHVRNQRGSYEQAFANHVTDPRVHEWKVALTEAANLAGWHIQPDRSESEYVKDIAEDVREMLNLRYPNELEGLFGIAEPLRQIKSSLRIGSNEVRIIGIWGMGGLGKTTLASALYVKLSSSFEGRCFLGKLGEGSKTNGSNALGTLLFDLLGEENLKRIEAPEHVPSGVKNRLQCKKVFIVLDGVTTLQQFTDLVISHNCLGSGSKVIVTSRNKHALSLADEVYKVKPLNRHDSVKLFCKRAFSEMRLKDGYEELLQGVIAYCKGVPLALEVLGLRLRGKSKEVWEDDLNKLQRFPNVEIQEVLKLSYDSLDPTQKAIFLDIAFLLNGEDHLDKDYVTTILNACDLPATSGIPSLVDKALISVTENEAIEMHDLIRQMAWEIVREESTGCPGKQSRLCNPEDVCDVLEYNTGTDAIEGIRLDVSKIESLHLNPGSFTKMSKLRYLHFYGGNFIDVCDVGDVALGPVSFSRRLRSLRWQGYCFKTLPSNFYARMLVELDMRDSNLEKLWGGTMRLDNLKRINLGGSRRLVEVPDLSLAPNLDIIYLDGCERLREVHPSIFFLPKLRFLDLSYCTQIESLKTNFHSTSLKKLLLEGCSSLKEFSVTSEAMVFLNLSSTSIHELPSSFLRNRNLYALHLGSVGNLGVVGKNLVDAGGMGSLNSLELCGFKELNVSELGIILGGLPSVEHLTLIECYNMRALPNVIKNLSKLKFLSIYKCTELEFVPELPPYLMGFCADNCTSLKSVMNLTDSKVLPSLDNVKLKGTKIEVIYLPPFVTKLNASDCKSLKMVFNADIDENWSSRLNPAFGGTLELNFSNCCNLEKLPENISRLYVLKIDECRKLEVPPEIQRSLGVVSAINCTSLDTNWTQRQLPEHVIRCVREYAHAYYDILVPGDHVPDWFRCTTGTSITFPHLPLYDLHGFLCCHVLSSSKFKSNDVYCRITQDGSSEFLYRRRSASRSKNFILGHLMIWFFDLRDDHHKIQKNGVNGLFNNITLELGHFGHYCDDSDCVDSDCHDSDCHDSEVVTSNQMKGCGVLPLYYWIA